MYLQKANIVDCIKYMEMDYYYIDSNQGHKIDSNFMLHLQHLFQLIHKNLDHSPEHSLFHLGRLCKFLLMYIKYNMLNWLNTKHNKENKWCNFL